VFVVLDIQHAQAMRRTVLPSVACADLPYFTYIISQTARFLEKDLTSIKYVFWFPLKNLGEAFLVLRRILPDITINAQTANCKVTVIIVRFYGTVIPTTDIHLSIRYFNSCRRLPETNHHFSLFLHWFGSKFPVDMAACTAFIHIFPGRPLFLLSRAVQSIINFSILFSGRQKFIKCKNEFQKSTFVKIRQIAGIKHFLS